MNQDILEGPEPEPSESSGILRWLIVALVFALIVGGGIWYYMYYIQGGGKIEPSPSVEVTEAVWKTKSEKTVTDFLNYWASSGSSGEQLINAKKAKDLLTISAQARLETFKDGETPITDVSKQLDRFIEVTSKTTKFIIISSSKTDDKNVQVKIKLNYPTPVDKVVYLMSENNIWLIDKIVNSEVPFQSSIGPSANVTPSP